MDQSIPRPAPLTPVSETTGARILAASGSVPAGAAPQLRMANPKELEIAQPAPLVLYGFNLKGVSISAKPQAGGEEKPLKVEQVSAEEVRVPAAEWQTLGKGVFSISAANAAGAVGILPVPINIE